MKSESHNVCLAGTDACAYHSEQEFTIDKVKVEYVQCYKACPKGKFLQKDRATCGTTCASGFYTVVEAQSVCVDGCADYAYRKSGEPARCVGQCPAGSRPLGSKICVPSCVGDEFFDQASKSCMTKLRCTSADKYLYASGEES